LQRNTLRKEPPPILLDPLLKPRSVS
jgi:hypothetical protein